jgi:lipid II:glycine glycyltransferase (peptidoglycan interpeptide bridge formation enzyme)
MKILEVKQNQKQIWNDFVANHAYGHFLQSFEWGEVVLADGEKIRRIAVLDYDRIIAAVQLIIYRLPLKKSYLYIPRGPVLDWDKIKEKEKVNQAQESLMMILDEVSKIANQENALFLRIDPEIKNSTLDKEFWQQIGFIKSSKEMQPKMTVCLDLSKSEDELLKNMKPKTRYNIRLSLRKGVKVFISDNISDVDTFYSLMFKTSKRDKFYPHIKRHYEDIIKILGQDGKAKLFLAKYKNKIIASTIVSFFGQKSVYMHGASDSQYRNLMSTYLLQYQAMLEAKKMGCLLYDFGGVVPEDEINHSWAGISRFKRGFGGEELKYIGAFDLPYSSSQYKLFSLTTRIRRKIKGA